MKRKAKKPLRLVLFFSLCFAIILVLCTIIRFLEFRAGDLRNVMGGSGLGLPGFISAFRWALIPALYLSILLGLSYASRKNIPFLLSVPFLLLLSLGAVLGISLGIERLQSMPPGLSAAPAGLGGKGLLISRSGAAMILLRGPADSQGPRVVSLPGQPLIYQEHPLGPVNSASLPPLPFRDETPPVLSSLFIDFSLTARQFENRQKEGLLSLAVYAASLILLLVSLKCVLDIGSWALASLFLGALVFRGILALETFLNAQETQEILASFLGERVPASLISPLAFVSLGLIILLYTSLVYLVRGRGTGDV